MMSVTVSTDRSNSTDELRRKMDIFTIVIYSLIFLLGVTGNGLVIFITSFRMKRTVNTVWFLNLAIADVIFIFCLPLNITNKALEKWPFGPVMCKIGGTLSYTSFYASIYFLVVLSLDRCIFTRWPVWAHNHRTPQRATIAVLGVWILALVLCSHHLFLSKEISTPDGKKECVLVYDSAKKLNAVITGRFIVAFIIPFGIIVTCYGAVVLKLKRNQLSQSSKPFKVITAVTVAFFVCWLPCHIFFFYQMKAGRETFFIIGEPLAYSLAFLNSCLNPILYAFMGYDFKQKLRLLSAFENAFAEDSARNRGSTNIQSSPSLELQ